MSPTPASSVRAYEATTWDLTDLVAEPVSASLDEEIGRLDAAVEAFARERETLQPDIDPRAFLDLVRQYERLIAQMTKLGAYASLRFAENTQSSEALSLIGRIEQVLARHDNRTLFFGLWWKALEDEEAEQLLPTAEAEPDLRHFLLDLRRTRPHTLEERSEQILNLKNTNGVSALLTLYAMLTSRLSFELEVDGETRTLTDDEMRSQYFAPDADLRERAYRESFRVYKHEAPVLAQIYANRVRDWHTEGVELRAYASPIAVRNAANDVPDAAIETLLEVVRENVPMFQDYFRLKAGWLGMDRLRRFDLYAPLAATDRSIPYAEAVTSVLETFDGFHPKLATLAERVFAQGHIDAEVRPGKKGGAFCSTVLPEHTPWVLINYNGRLRDVATLAHELGHAIHSMLADHHSVLTQHPCLPLAETASVFAEMLMTDRLLAAESNPLIRRELLASAVDDVYATVLRQAFFVRFEREAHAAILDNATAEDLDRIYLGNLEEQFGDSLHVDPGFSQEWVSIPHLFHTPFYCYAYSFGQLLVLALYRRYLEQGEAFKPGYLRLLAHGGGARPVDVLAELDIDIADRAFWQGGFDVVRGMIDELREL